ncbi:hypothetical protein [Microcoleus asticus]|uniref:Uncharacterized protein n=1 Tax=Microcoleus asticus IPMA8 TaxID=2563858 RepID=A0ABX2D8K8_9CYAN|nr:hypothetical protein [Microcoleus asticus]NQE38478.1 hypothetical protein [Microcoleus asticus IPMA8]
MTTATTATKMKVIAPIFRPDLQEFSLAYHPDNAWVGGVYVSQHGRKQLYFSC